MRAVTILLSFIHSFFSFPFVETFDRILLTFSYFCHFLTLPSFPISNARLYVNHHIYIEGTRSWLIPFIVTESYFAFSIYILYLVTGQLFYLSATFLGVVLVLFILPLSTLYTFFSLIINPVFRPLFQTKALF